MDRDRETLEAEFAARLLPIARGWRRVADRALGGLGLSSATAWPLVHCRRLGGRPRQTDLARALEIADASLVPLLDRLAAAGLLARVDDAGDARVRRVTLTAAGEAQAERIEGVLAGLRRALLAGIPDTELAAAARVVARTGEALAAAGEARA